MYFTKNYWIPASTQPLSHLQSVAEGPTKPQGQNQQQWSGSFFGLLARLLIGTSGHRPGVILNLTTKEVINAKEGQDDHAIFQKELLLLQMEHEKLKPCSEQDGELHYICRRKKDNSQHLAKVVLLPKEAHNIFMEFHAGPLGGHCGVERTHNAIILRFYWPGMEQDIRKWVTEPLELLGMDLIGKLTPTENGHQYICVMVDYFTKWSEAYPLRTKNADEVTSCILDFFYKFGAPKRILTDQGREFVNKVNFSLCDKLGITRSLCSPYHPQTNGLVEKLNGTIHRSLTKMVGENPFFAFSSLVGDVIVFAEVSTAHTKILDTGYFSSRRIADGNQPKLSHSYIRNRKTMESER
ncbi:gypsy retrotransposon integrase 1-like protein [Labeo rohita]|uniref:Gypsy retrotransposon integrase-like protein 1 n=1 Tax=Labeo rohita TaxID=84645 RepID=A0A498NPX3_LABRO|nr:gypsy retrotransposon integrase 1-like protein [Labeo rohita]